MKVGEVAAEYDLLYPNGFPPETKYRLVSELDSRVFREVISAYDANNGEVIPSAFDGYSYPGDSDTPVLIPDGFESVYIHYIASRLENANGETARAQNESIEFNTLFRDYQSYYARTHLSKCPKRLKP